MSSDTSGTPRARTSCARSRQHGRRWPAMRPPIVKVFMRHYTSLFPSGPFVRHRSKVLRPSSAARPLAGRSERFYPPGSEGISEGAKPTENAAASTRASVSWVTLNSNFRVRLSRRAADASRARRSARRPVPQIQCRAGAGGRDASPGPRSSRSTAPPSRRCAPRRKSV